MSERPINIVCLCVTENRAAAFPIAFASWQEQTLARSYRSRLLVLDRSRDAAVLSVLATTGVCAGVSYFNTVGDDQAWGEGVPARLAIGCRLAFDMLHADLVTMWDDDDWSPPDRLAQTAEVFAQNGRRCCFIGYDRGYFVNARTWHGEYKQVPHLWGASLTFSYGVDYSLFLELPFPGYDRGLVDLHPTVPRYVLPTAEGDSLPIAFSHGRNVATFLSGAGALAEMRLRAWLGPKSMAAVSAFREFLINRRVYPPQP